MKSQTSNIVKSATYLKWTDKQDTQIVHKNETIHLIMKIIS